MSVLPHCIPYTVGLCLKSPSAGVYHVPSKASPRGQDLEINCFVTLHPILRALHGVVVLSRCSG